MPAIAASGQIYVLNGQLTVTSGPGGYLATGSPLVYIGSIALPVGTTNATYTIPAGARALVVNSSRELNKISVYVQGVTSGITCLHANDQGSGPLAAQIPNGTDTQVSVQLVNNSGSADTGYLWWSYSLDDYGSSSVNDADTYRPPLGIGKFTMITNDRTPIRIGDDSQDPQRANIACSGTGNSVIVGAPGAGYSLVLWLATLICIPSTPTGLVDLNDGFVNYAVLSSNSDAKSFTYNLGGIRLPPNTALTCGFFNCGSLSQANVFFTVELT